MKFIMREDTNFMIGDWVKICNNKGRWIDNVRVDLDLLLRQREGVVILRSIYITPEFLKKNGFMSKSDGWLWCENIGIEDKNYIFIQFRKNGEPRTCELNFTGKVNATYKKICEVHELQHLIVFSKIKKNIII